MLFEKTSSKLGSAETDEEKLSMTCSGEQKPIGKKKAESRNTNTTKKSAREMHNKHDEPYGEHNTHSDFGKATQHLIECVAIVPRPRRYCYSHQSTRMRQSVDGYPDFHTQHGPLTCECQLHMCTSLDIVPKQTPTACSESQKIHVY